MHVRRSALVAHSAERIFGVIEAAEHYPDFLPWCARATIIERSDEVVAACIEVAWHGVRFGFVTRNPKRAPTWMAIGLEEGPFRRFSGQWNLRPLANAGCRVDFSLDYEFDSRTLGTLAAPVFDRAANTLVDAFVARADRLAVLAPRPAPPAPFAQPHVPSPAPPPPRPAPPSTPFPTPQEPPR
jgi:ribosome-associated toxin RatA of RatAB toxin-antitoxin module